MKIKYKIMLSIAFVLFGVLSRILPHAWNFTPLAAIALFSGSYLGLRYSLMTTFAAMYIGDVFIGGYQWQIMLAVYASFALIGVIGWYLKKVSVGTVASSALISSLLFFAISNWAVWQFGTMYDHTFAGLMQCYTLAIPFFKNTVAGDLFYSGLLFGGYELFRASTKVSSLAHQHVEDTQQG
jgi:hypothetical protein